MDLHDLTLAVFALLEPQDFSDAADMDVASPVRKARAIRSRRTPVERAADGARASQLIEPAPAPIIRTLHDVAFAGGKGRGAPGASVTRGRPCS